MILYQNNFKNDAIWQKILKESGLTKDTYSITIKVISHKMSSEIEFSVTGDQCFTDKEDK